MKQRFFLYIFGMLLMIFAFCLTAIHHMWFSMIGAGVVCLVCIAFMYKWLMHTLDLLEAERMIQRKSEKERSIAEAQLIYYKMLMEKVDTAVMVVTRNGQVEWCNAAATRLIGKNEVLPFDIVNGIARKEGSIRLEGREYVVSQTNITIGAGNRIIVAMKDIQSTMERTEVDSWHKLVRVLTHEIMNSISPIISLSETLCEIATLEKEGEKDKDDDASLYKGLDIIRRRSQGLLAFVENYRKLTRVALPEKGPVNVAAFFDDLRKLYPQPFVSFKIESDKSDTFYADRGQMEQVLINLLKNAIEATTPETAQVVCSFHIEKVNGNDVSIITVEDNGRGILPEVQEQIFVPFFTTKKNGSGIGLSLCKQIIMNHGGEITVRSEEGKGCTIEIRL